MIIAGIAAAVLFILMACVLVLGIINDDKDAIAGAFVVAWFLGALGSVALLVFGIIAIIEVVTSLT